MHSRFPNYSGVLRGAGDDRAWITVSPFFLVQDGAARRPYLHQVHNSR